MNQICGLKTKNTRFGSFTVVYDSEVIFCSHPCSLFVCIYYKRGQTFKFELPILQFLLEKNKSPKRYLKHSLGTRAKLKICAKNVNRENSIDSCPLNKKQIKVFTVAHLLWHEAHLNMGRHLSKKCSEIRFHCLRKEGKRSQPRELAIAPYRYLNPLLRVHLTVVSLQQSVHSFKKNTLAPDAPPQALGGVTPGNAWHVRGLGTSTRQCHWIPEVSSEVVLCSRFLPSLVGMCGASLWRCCAIGHGKVLLQHHQRAAELRGEGELT